MCTIKTLIYRTHFSITQIKIGFVLLFLFYGEIGFLFWNWLCTQSIPSSVVKMSYTKHNDRHWESMPYYGCILPPTHNCVGPTSCEYEEIYTHKRVYFFVDTGTDLLCMNMEKRKKIWWFCHKSFFRNIYQLDRLGRVQILTIHKKFKKNKKYWQYMWICDVFHSLSISRG